MFKFLSSEQASFSQLPLDEFNQVNQEIYVLDHNWNYLFANDLARCKNNLGDLKSCNFWEKFPELLFNEDFIALRTNMQNNLVTTFVTTAFNNHRINVLGFALTDCYYLSKAAMPNKQDLMMELRGALGKMSA